MSKAAARTGQPQPKAGLARPTLILAIALAVAVLVAGGLGVAWAMKDSGPTFTTTTCEAGAPGCELRQQIHEHADFALFIDGKQFDFNTSQFLSTEGDERSPNVHIHAPRPTVVHSHLSGSTWDEFFRSLGFELNDPTIPAVTPETSSLKLPDGTVLQAGNGKTFKFFVNGVRVDGVSDYDVSDLDRVLISYGSETPEQVQATQVGQVTDQACIPSERCKERIPVNEPPEQCTKSNNTCAK